jgi:hypothetical protein
MIKEEEIIINGHSRNYLYYKKLGYEVFIRKPVLIKTKDLMPGSAVMITSICSNCLSELKNAFKDYYNYTNGFKNNYYCNSCNHIKSKNTCLEKYGVENPMQLDSVKSILKESLLEKYGVDHYSKTDEFKIKFRETSLSKFGVDNPSKSDEIKDRIKEIFQIRYGKNSPLINDYILEECKKSLLEKYGVDHYSKTDEFNKKVIETCLERYGVENPMQCLFIKNKVKISNLERYGVDHYSKTDKYKVDSKHKKERNTYKKFLDLLKKEYHVLSYSNEQFKILHDKCNSEFEIYKGLVIARNRLNICICTVCNPVGVQSSFFESEIRSFLDDEKIKYEVKNRTILGGRELDIYIPNLNISIEANGLYWHSELFKSKNYHLNKTLDCLSSGIKLLHIWEDDWKNKRDIVKSIILNKIGLIKNKIYARKCIIKSVDSNEARDFLNMNHIQGFSSSHDKIGLYHENKLVSLMTFGYRFTNGKKEFELIRFCNLINSNIVGSSSKLFNFFIKNNMVNEIISYSDISLFNGEMYKILNFRKVGLSNPNYFWVVNGNRRHRFNYNKKKLIKMGYDPIKTEVEIMHDMKYYRIYSCGQEKWVWNRQNKPT